MVVRRSLEGFSALRTPADESSMKNLFLVALLACGGCTTMMVAEMIMAADTSVSITVSGDEAELESMFAAMSSQFEVETPVRAVQTGVRVLEIVGTYVAVLEAMNWMMAKGLTLMANDALSEAILYGVFK